MVEIPEFTQEWMSEVLEGLAERWRTIHNGWPITAHDYGRASGYVQSIALILGCQYQDVRQALESGRWWDAGNTG